MTNTEAAIPTQLEQIIEDFSWAEGREKLDMLIEYAESLPDLPEWLQAKRAEMEPVPECMTPVFMEAELQDGGMHFYFDVPRESPTVRGFASLMSQGVEGASPEQILKIPAGFYQQMGLDQVLTQQRLNGISAILAHMKQMALRVMASSTHE
jgi:cysteine desulfuration protein SufE